MTASATPHLHIKEDHRLAGLGTVPQVALYLLLFLGAFEGLRASANFPVFALQRGGYEGLLFLLYGAGFAAFGLVCGGLFLLFYLLWRTSRPAAVFAVSLGLYTWTLLICFYIALNMKMLYRDIKELRNSVSNIRVVPVPKSDSPFSITVTPQDSRRPPLNRSPLSVPNEFDVVDRLFSIAFFGAVALICASVLRRPSHPLPSAKFESGTQPRLREILEDTARHCGVSLPENIYWIPKPNAQVMMVGGWLGLGAKPAIAIGLPLLRVLSVDELRATLAHEFHHLRRGDASLFGCIYNARRVAEEIVKGLQTHSQIFSNFFFTVYSSFLWRLGMPIVRNWEFEADSFAARAVSPRSMACALVKLDFAQSRFDAFRRNWLEPALDSGYAPPAMSGFWEYYEQCALQERNHGRLITAGEVNRQSDTHPTLRERLLRLAQLDASSAAVSDNSAFLLIDRPDLVEAEVYPRKMGARTETVWSTEVLRTLMTRWEREVLAATPRRLGAINVDSLPKFCSSLPFAATFLGFEKKESEATELILMKAFAVALSNSGWTPVLERGRLLFRRDAFAVDTAAELRRLKMRQVPEWQTRCEDWNIIGLLLLPDLPQVSQSSRRGRFCSRCLRSLPSPVDRCPVCHKLL